MASCSTLTLLAAATLKSDMTAVGSISLDMGKFSACFFRWSDAGATTIGFESREFCEFCVNACEQQIKKNK